jgi:hypothetical protein
MTIGARRAFRELTCAEQDHWLDLPFLGCDGRPNAGQVWVRKGLLRATVVSPPYTGQAIEMLVNWLRSGLIQPVNHLRCPVPILVSRVLSGNTSLKHAGVCHSMQFK